jgi:hypothetical protein
VTSEKEKIHHYRKGLNAKIKVALGGTKSRTLRDLIDRCIQIEKDQIEAGEESRREKRRSEFSHRGSDRKRFHRDGSSSGRPRYYRDDASGSGKSDRTYTADYSRSSRDHYSRGRSRDRYSRDRSNDRYYKDQARVRYSRDRSEPPRHKADRPAPAHAAPGTGNWRAPVPTPAGGTAPTCFNCAQPGHKVAQCPLKATAPAAQKAPYRGSASRGRLNHITTEEARAAPDVV